MPILKINDHYLNTDLMTDVHFDLTSATVYLASQRGDRPHLVQLRGADASAGRQWLDDHSIDIVNPPQTAVGPRPGSPHR